MHALALVNEAGVIPSNVMDYVCMLFAVPNMPDHMKVVFVALASA